MTDVLAIDTGERTGWAYFRSGKLTTVATCSHEEFFEIQWVAPGMPTSLNVQIEQPKFYPHGKNKTDVDDLLGLAIKVGEMCRFFLERGIAPHLVFPHEWKGQLPKDVCQRRCEGKLSNEEKAVLPKRMSNHAWDAIGIGLWVHGRF